MDNAAPEPSNRQKQSVSPTLTENKPVDANLMSSVVSVTIAGCGGK